MADFGNIESLLVDDWTPRKGKALTAFKGTAAKITFRWNVYCVPEDKLPSGNELKLPVTAAGTNKLYTPPPTAPLAESPIDRIAPQLHSSGGRE